MNNIIYLKKINQPHILVSLDARFGTFSQAPSEADDVCGNYARILNQNFAIFAADQTLYFQWNERRWNLSDLESKIKYEHDFQRKTTSFSVDDARIQYPAWWADDATFDPNLPERDEEEDFLAYVANLASNQDLQVRLIQVWSV